MGAVDGVLTLELVDNVSEVLDGLTKRIDGELAESFGRVAFEAYGESVGGKTYDGKPIPGWEQLTDVVRAGWIAAAGAASVKVIGELVSLRTDMHERDTTPGAVVHSFKDDEQ